MRGTGIDTRVLQSFRKFKMANTQKFINALQLRFIRNDMPSLLGRYGHICTTGLVSFHLYDLEDDVTI